MRAELISGGKAPKSISLSLSVEGFVGLKGLKGLKDLKGLRLACV